jgi:hypothetical protein
LPTLKRPAALALAVCLILAQAPGAAAQEPVDLQMMTRIRDEGFRNSKVMETLGSPPT